MNRRALLRGTAMVSAAWILASCGQTTSQIAADVSAISTAFTKGLPSLLSIPGIAASVATQLSGYLADIKSIATTIGANASATTMQQFVQDVEAFADLALPLIPGGAGFMVAINAALSLLPAILAAVGVSASAMAAPAMTDTQARAALKAFNGN